MDCAKFKCEHEDYCEVYPACDTDCNCYHDCDYCLYSDDSFECIHADD